MAIKSLIVTVCICGVINSIITIISPAGQIKKMTEVAVSIIIMSAILLQILSFIGTIIN